MGNQKTGFDTTSEYSYGATQAQTFAWSDISKADRALISWWKGSYSAFPELARWAPDTIMIGECAWEHAPILLQGMVHRNRASLLIDASFNPANPSSKTYWNWVRHFDGMNMLLADSSVTLRRREQCRISHVDWHQW